MLGSGSGGAGIAWFVSVGVALHPFVWVLGYRATLLCCLGPEM